MSSVPSIANFRKIVDKIRPLRDKLLIETYYLTASRACELLTKTTPYDLEHGKSHPYGSELEWSLEDYVIPGTKEVQTEKVLLLKVKVAKRKKKLVKKAIALPCDPRFEPWTLDLLTRIKNTGTINFDLTRTRVWQIVKKHLARIDPDVKTHSLRHYRLTHLVDLYGFSEMELIIYAGWTYSAAFGGRAAMLDVYIHLDWRKYFPKLLREIRLT
jgi:integrase